MSFSSSLLNNIRIVLVETSHTGNIGSVARAMKTMGLTQLYLVNPMIKPDSQSIALAAGASELIHQAVLTTSLEIAIAECTLVIGASARSRTVPWPMLDARQAGEKSVQEAQEGKVAIVFGRERVGLTNDELQKCHYHVMIPSNPDYSSLNLAMAVQILCYEIRMAVPLGNNTGASFEQATPIFPQADELEQFYQHLNQTLADIDFTRDEQAAMLMSRLRRFFTRARLEKQELNIFRGILTAIQKRR